ncbi:family 16 glycoside hydrolase [Cohnella hashimotonis]|uniref:DUF1080 domain-containing protein n=1 Tax=Cohnella hashimotonis TaxID=2826895 RepID=A0ABT6TJQ5_9BACL|nr:family 16 glycoside hydrolase [Cohnella hashimotonis]MDI4647076.1 DUF1080 domain-containing protein [Cohnella hashimotonis]
MKTRSRGKTTYKALVLGLVAAMLISAQASASDATAPTAPSGLTAYEMAAGTVELGWNASEDDTGVDHYAVFRDCSQIGTTSATTYTDSGVPASADGYYYVLAYDAANNDSGGSGACVTTLAPDVTPPSVPGSVAAALQGKSVRLTWAASTDDRKMAGYKVYRDNVQVAVVSGTQYTDTSVVSSTSYAYTVAAYDDSGNVSAASAPVTMTTPNYLHFSNFESGAGDWAVVTGTWNVVNDGSRVYNSGTTFDNSSAVGSASWTDYTVETRVKVNGWSSTNSPNAGIRLRFADKDNYYFLGYKSGSLTIYRRVAGANTGLGSKAYTLQTGEWYTFKAVVQGTSLKLYVNGTLEVSATDNKLAAGKAGLDSRFADARYDDFTVWDG